jgi:2-polyprenyl-3-methyl-5-hydroxy-6-metoxy-1,4-benzoquinol methylase
VKEPTKISNPEYSVERIVARMKEAATRAGQMPDRASLDVVMSAERQPLRRGSKVLSDLDLQPIQLQARFQPNSDARYHVNDLLKFHDAAFIQNAYRAILKRGPDAVGYRTFLDSLRNARLNKIDILGRLRYSTEGKAKQVEIEGLWAPATLRKIYRVPFIGYFVNLLVAVARLPTLVRNQQQFEAHIIAQQEIIVEHLNHADRSLLAHVDEVSDILQTQGDTIKSLLEQADQTRAYIVHSQQRLDQEESRSAGFTEQYSTLRADLESTMRQLRASIDNAGLELTRALENRSAELKGLLDSYSGELRSLMDSNRGELRSLIDGNNGDLRSLIDGNSGELRSLIDSNSGELRSLIDGNNGELRSLIDSNSGALRSLMDSNRGELIRDIETKLSEERSSRADFGQKINETTARLAENLSDLDKRVKQWLLVLRLKEAHFDQSDASQREQLDQQRGEIQRQREQIQVATRELKQEVTRVFDKQQQVSAELVLQGERLATVLAAARKRLPAFDEKELRALAREEDHALDAFYASFDEQFRGRREDIKQRLRIYLPKINQNNIGTESMPILDVGSGRGEWLELLKDEGLQARGVDSNRILVEWCQNRNLDVAGEDLIEYLHRLPDASLGAVTGFHIIEHLPIETLVEFLNQAVRVLKPGGAVIFETPNPQNVLVGSCNFYFDPTHRNPLPSAVTRFLVESRGFNRVEVMNLNPSDDTPVDENSELARRFNQYFYGPMDYAVIGFRS